VIDLLTIGEAMGALRADRPLQVGTEMRLSIAGAESNVAIGAARLGHSVRWAGVVGADQPGTLIVRTLRAEGVDAAVRVDADAPTGLILFEQRLADITRVSYHRAGSAGSHLHPEDVEAAFDPVPRLLHLTGITPALGRDSAAAVEHAMALARKHSVPVCLDVNYRGRLWDPVTAAAVLRPLAVLADIVVASDDELEVVSRPGADTLQSRISGLLDAGVREVVVKQGGAGASLHMVSSKHQLAAYPVTAVDSVGAGDAFVAGYLSGLLDGLDPTGRLDRAVCLGAFAVASHGDWEGLPTRADLPLIQAAAGTAVR
jgi:2-dehydro-3-deoxygluconokinase